MRKILWFATVGILLSGVAWFFLSTEDRQKQTFTVAVLQYTGNNLTTLDGFKAGLAELGYEEGKTIRYLFSGPINQKDELPNEMERLLAKHPDLVFASPTPAAVAARQATVADRIPVVFAPVNDPIAAGIIKDIRNPGGNITGVRLGASDGRRLQWLKEISSSVSHVAVPYSARDKSALTSVSNAEEAAEKIGIELILSPIRDHKDIDDFLQNIPETADAVFLPRDGMVMSRIRDFISVSIRKKLMLSTPRLLQVEMGALTGYGFIGFQIGKQAAGIADQILKGADPGALPVETAEDYFFLNLKTAREIGLSIDDHVLRQAHVVVKDE